MQPLRISALLIAILLSGSACSEADGDARATATTATDKEAGLPGGVTLERDGVTAVHAEGTRTKIAFGTPTEEVRDELTIILGEPDTEAAITECSAGIIPDQIVWPGFLMLSVDGKFAGWAAKEDEYAVLERGQRITIGSPLKLVSELLGPLELAQSPRGFEFVLTNDDKTIYAGAFPSQEPTAPLIAFAAGLTCFAR